MTRAEIDEKVLNKYGCACGKCSECQFQSWSRQQDEKRKDKPIHERTILDP